MILDGSLQSTLHRCSGYKSGLLTNPSQVLFGVYLSIPCHSFFIHFSSCTCFTQYSGIWNLTIQNLETFEIWTFSWSDFKGSGFSYCYGPNHSKSGHFCPDMTKWWPFIQIQMVVLLDFRSRLKSGPFANQPLFDHWNPKSRLVRISYPLCI